MVSIPGRYQVMDIKYNRHSAGSPRSPLSSEGSPLSASSWETSMLQLARELKLICRSPDRTERLASLSTSSSSSTPPASPIPSPPTPGTYAVARDQVCPLADIQARPMPIRHQHSEEKLKEKLSKICSSPRNRHASQKNPRKPPPAPVRPQQRRLSFRNQMFRARVDIGDLKVEDLQVAIEKKTLRINRAREDVKSDLLPFEVELPEEVDPEKLMCVVRDGVLEVKESRRRNLPPKLLNVNGVHPGRRSPGFTEQTGPDVMHRPIVIEDDGSAQLKLVLRIPAGYQFEDLQIKLIDDHLIVSTKPRSNALCRSISLDERRGPVSGSANPVMQGGFTKVFELPDTADPYSMTACLTDQNQLVIHAVLSQRSRCYTF